MILVISVNYNNSKLTNQMLLSIRDSETDVIVVDNNSSDKEDLHDIGRVRFKFLNKNIGYFPAINEGLKEFDISKYKYVIICNNDLVFNKDFFDKLKSAKYENNYYAICPRILDLDNTDQNPMLDKKISHIKIYFYDLYYKNYNIGQFLYKIWQKFKKKTRDVNLTSRHIFMGYGAIYILTKNFFQENKLLESPPFLMFEETFLAYQIYKTGGIEYFDSNLTVYHQDHSTCSKIPRRQLYDIYKTSYKYFREKILKLPEL
jgi:GT2 family glycosyltransferase